MTFPQQQVGAVPGQSAGADTKTWMVQSQVSQGQV